MKKNKGNFSKQRLETTFINQILYGMYLLCMEPPQMSTVYDSFHVHVFERELFCVCGSHMSMSNLSICISLAFHSDWQTLQNKQHSVGICNSRCASKQGSSVLLRWQLQRVHHWHLTFSCYGEWLHVLHYSVLTSLPFTLNQLWS